MYTDDMQATRYHERMLKRKGYTRIAGVDEVGRGAWAGPLVAAAVILPSRHSINGIDDSKRLTPATREALFERITKCAVSWAVHAVSPMVIDKRGISFANKLAIKRAIVKLSTPPDFVLVDALPVHFRMPSRSIIHGDAISESIAAASIVAKVTRDRMMSMLNKRFPGYAFDVHKGYGTSRHMTSLYALGTCAIHRLSFAPIRDMVKKNCQ
ncbi:MAG: ribonuclease HII [Parcubacteria group bacterium]